MSRSQKLIFNCGASHVTAALFSVSGGKIQLEKLASENLDYDYSDDTAWLEALGVALRKLSRSEKFSGRATFIIPGSQILTKTIRVPHVEKAKRAQVIAFEAQQNIPYPLTEVVWDSQIVGDDGVETEVLFIACKKDAIDRFCAKVRQAGLTPESVGAATVLDYNALRYAYPGLEGDSLLINIGARSTNLLFTDGNGFFVRNITLGGNSLTQNIADNLGKKFLQSEEIKLKFFGGEQTFSGDDSGAKLLNSNAEAFMSRMSQEITRSIVNYRRQKGGAAPKRIFLTGRGALLKGLPEHLAASQKVEVEFFDPLKNVVLDHAIDSSSHEVRLQLGEIIGEASQDIVEDSAGVNLLPDELRTEIEFAGKKPWLLVAAACLALAPIPPYLALRQGVSTQEQQVLALRGQVPGLQSLNSRIAQNIETATALSSAIRQVEGLVDSKSNWIQFFAELQTSLDQAKDVWLDELEVIRGTGTTGGSRYEVALTGQMLVRDTSEGSGAIDQDAIARRINDLRASLASSAFIESAKAPVITWTSIQQGLKVLPFRINLVVNEDKPI